MQRNLNNKTEMIRVQAKDLRPTRKNIFCAYCGVVVSGDDFLFPFPVKLVTGEFPDRTIDVCFCLPCMKSIMYGELELVDPKDQ